MSEFTRLSRARLRRRHQVDDKGQPLPTEPCDSYERRGLMHDGLPVEGCEDYCRCGFPQDRHEVTDGR